MGTFQMPYVEENRGIAMNTVLLFPKTIPISVGGVELLSAARADSARSVNALMTATYWKVEARRESPDRSHSLH